MAAPMARASTSSSPTQCTAMSQLNSARPSSTGTTILPALTRSRWRASRSRRSCARLVVSLYGDAPECPVREANLRAHGSTAWKFGQCDVVARWDGTRFVYRMLVP
jgi:hypothetical protein